MYCQRDKKACRRRLKQKENGDVWGDNKEEGNAKLFEDAVCKEEQTWRDYSV